jgi:hypothetical protein
MHNRSRHVIPQLRRPLNIRTISVATKLAVRSCFSPIYTFNLPYDSNANVVHSRHPRATPRILQRFLPIGHPPTSKNGNAPRVSPQAYLTLALHRPHECRGRHSGKDVLGIRLAIRFEFRRASTDLVLSFCPRLHQVTQNGRSISRSLRPVQDPKQPFVLSCVTLLRVFPTRLPEPFLLRKPQSARDEAPMNQLATPMMPEQFRKKLLLKRRTLKLKYPTLTTLMTSQETNRDAQRLHIRSAGLLGGPTVATNYLEFAIISYP